MATDTQENPSIYDDLPPEHIRLLAPIEESHLPMTWALVTIPLDDTEQGQFAYTALSYCWGSAAIHGQYVINMRSECGVVPTPVTKNLFQALHQFRHNKERSGYIWADALCINQHDTKERNHQVAIMGRVYRKAELVLCWLGSDENGSGDAIANLHWRLSEASSRSRKGHRVFDIFDVTTMKPGFEVLYNSGWFDRAWCFQEIVLARQAVLQCGPSQLPWKMLLRMCLYCFEGLSGLGRFDAIGDQVRLIKRAQDSHGDAVTLLATIWTRKASDPRDKVFATLGLWPSKGILDPDYDLTMREVYLQAAKTCLEHSSSLRILTCVGLCPMTTNVREREQGDKFVAAQLPSWAPNWEVAPSPEFLSHFLDNKAGMERNSHSQEDSDYEIQRSLPSQSNRVEIRASDRWYFRDTWISQAPSDVRLAHDSLIATGIAVGRVFASFRRSNKFFGPWRAYMCRLKPMGKFNALQPQLRRFRARNAGLEIHPFRKASDDVYHGVTLECPRAVYDDDWIVAFFGCPDLLILRPTSKGVSSERPQQTALGTFSIIGPSRLYAGRSIGQLARHLEYLQELAFRTQEPTRQDHIAIANEIRQGYIPHVVDNEFRATSTACEANSTQSTEPESSWPPLNCCSDRFSIV